MYILFQFLSVSRRSHCFSTACSFSSTHPPCFCLSSRHGRWQRGLFLLIFHDLYFLSSDVEINFSLGQKQTVLLMCGWRGQLIVNNGRIRPDRGRSNCMNGSENVCCLLDLVRACITLVCHGLAVDFFELNK